MRGLEAQLTSATTGKLLRLGSPVAESYGSTNGLEPTGSKPSNSIIQTKSILVALCLSYLTNMLRLGHQAQKIRKALCEFAKNKEMGGLKSKATL
mmetsp:Transcript_37896/g.78704  ORF Transcript_37896/g.78704 Transcript_37896/m.78704 type:complete len:95 (-) Transcript_37896:904-1188(-)